MKQGVLVILGHKGSGKSELARAVIARVPRSVTIDTLDEYGGVIIEDPRSLQAYLEHARKRGHDFRVSYRDHGKTGVPMPRVFEMLHALRDCWLCLEEASKWMQSNASPEEVRWFLQYGRHARVSVLLVARRPPELDRMGTAQADTVVTFRQQEPRDLEYIAKLGGPEAAERAARLGEFEWDYVVDTHSEIRALLESVSAETGGRENVAELVAGDVEGGSAGAGARSDVSASPLPAGDGGLGDRAEGARLSGVVSVAGGSDAPGDALDGGSARAARSEPASSGESSNRGPRPARKARRVAAR